MFNCIEWIDLYQLGWLCLHVTDTETLGKCIQVPPCRVSQCLSDVIRDSRRFCRVPGVAAPPSGLPPPQASHQKRNRGNGRKGLFLLFLLPQSQEPLSGPPPCWPPSRSVPGLCARPRDGVVTVCVMKLPSQGLAGGQEQKQGSLERRPNSWFWHGISKVKLPLKHLEGQIYGP